MKNVTLENITKICGGTYYGPATLLKEEIQGAVTDSRKVEPGFLFLPVKGEKVDGHDFIGQVFEKGALCTLSERVLTAEDFLSAEEAGEETNRCGEETFTEGYPYILVDNTLAALKKIAAFYRQQLGIPVIGITGSVGKTSTKEMIASVLSEKYCVLKTEGNFNNEIGLPLTLLRIRPEHQVAVVEMGISDFGEMDRLGAMAKPNICVMTNIGDCHLENLGDREGVLRAKSEVLAHLTAPATVVLNGEDAKLNQITGVDRGRILRYYAHGTPDCIYIDQVENRGLKGSRAMLHTPVGETPITISIPGEHNLYNACAATGVGLSLGLTLEEIAAGIEKARTISGRSNLLEIGGMQVLDDCYNANPVSMRASLDVLSNGLGRRVAILGDMGELGKEEEALHAGVGAYAAQKGIEVMVFVGNLASHMAQAARDELGLSEAKENATDKQKVYYFETREDCIRALPNLLQPGDTVLVKASHFMGFPVLVEEIKKINFV